jgi:hypothetical protein
LGATNPTIDAGLRICKVTAELMACQSVGLALVVNHAYSQIAGSDKIASFLDETQFDLGDGPTFSAQNKPLPVLAEDLTSRMAFKTWPAFSPIAVKHNVRGVFAFPLRVGTAYLGTLTVYRELSGPLTATQFTDGLILSAVATEALLTQQAGVPNGGLSKFFAPGVYDQSFMHLAAGMVAEQMGSTIVEALVRIRAFAFAHDEPISEVTRQIINRDLILEK